MIKLIKSSDESAHQTVTEFIKLQTPDETIQIGFTAQKVSGRAGRLTFAEFLHWHRFGELLARVLPGSSSDAVATSESLTNDPPGSTPLLRLLFLAAGLWRLGPWGTCFPRIKRREV